MLCKSNGTTTLKNPFLIQVVMQQNGGKQNGGKKTSAGMNTFARHCIALLKYSFSLSTVDLQSKFLQCSVEHIYQGTLKASSYLYNFVSFFLLK